MNKEFGKKAYGFIDGPDLSQEAGKGQGSEGNNQPVTEVSYLYAGAEGLGVTTDKAFIHANTQGKKVERGK